MPSPADLFGFYSLLNAACNRGSAVHAEVLGLCSSSLLLLEMGFRLERGAIIEVFLLPSAFLSWRLTELCLASLLKQLPISHVRKGNHCVNMSSSELTNYSGHCTDFQSMENIGEFVSDVVRFISVPPRCSHFARGNRDIFVDLYIGY